MVVSECVLPLSALARELVVFPDLQPLRRPRIVGPRPGPPALLRPSSPARPFGPPRRHLFPPSSEGATVALDCGRATREAERRPAGQCEERRGGRPARRRLLAAAAFGRADRERTARAASVASETARRGPRTRRRRLGVLVLPRSSLSGAPLSWLWRRPVTAAMAAARPRGERAAAAACARRPHAEEPPLHGGPPRTGRGRRARRAPARPRGVRPRRRARVRGVRRRAVACASARGHGERRRPRRLGRRGGRTAAARASQGRPPWCRAWWPPWCRGRCRGRRA